MKLYFMKRGKLVEKAGCDNPDCPHRESFDLVKKVFIRHYEVFCSETCMKKCEPSCVQYGDPIWAPFENMEEHLHELEPQHWKRLVQFLEYHVDCTLKDRGIVPDETPLPIAEDVRLYE